MSSLPEPPRVAISELLKQSQYADLKGRVIRSVQALKHSRVSHLLSGGSPISEVGQRAGHLALSSTLRYVHSTDESAAKAARQAEANVF